MLDIGWSEMALILMVALIVIGPKDLPRVARIIGKWTGKARGMAREAELQDIKSEMDKLSRVDVRHRLEETIDPEGELRRSLAAPIGSDPEFNDPPYDEPAVPEAPKVAQVPAPVPTTTLPAPVPDTPPAPTELPAAKATGVEKS